MFDVAIIGGGIAGCAVAYKLSMYELNICVIEKENDVALGATRANSAIIHAGFDPEPGTLMARLNVEGTRQAPELCKRLGVHYKNTGSLVLAFGEEDTETVKRLYDRGVKNGVPGLRVLDGRQARELEPGISDTVTGALYAPSSGIVNPWEYAIAMAEVAALNGCVFSLETEVSSISCENGAWLLSCGDRQIRAKYVVNAAGVNSDLIHNMVAEPSFRTLPSKGQYWLMDKSEGKITSRTLFRCPTKAGKGVLVSPTVHGNLIVGPDASPGSRERVNTESDRLEYVKATALESVPGINFRNAIRTFAGIRANTDRDDFIIGIAAPNFIDLGGIKSPGLSAAPAIADEAIRLLLDCGAELEKKENPVTDREHVVFKDQTDEKKRELIRKNPLYGRVICRCETVTEAEIVQALRSPVPARTVDGVKRRANAGMGRCQGGFCGPRVLEIISRETGMSPLGVLKDKAGSYILCGQTKEADNV